MKLGVQTVQTSIETLELILFAIRIAFGSSSNSRCHCVRVWQKIMLTKLSQKEFGFHKLGMSADCLQIASRNNACSSLRSLVVLSWSLVPSGRPRPIGLPVHPLVSKWHRDTVSRWRLKQINKSTTDQHPTAPTASSNRCQMPRWILEDRLRNLSRRDLTRCVTYADRVIQYIQVSVAISTQIWPGAKHTVLPKNMHWHIVLY